MNDSAGRQKKKATELITELIILGDRYNDRMDFQK